MSSLRPFGGLLPRALGAFSLVSLCLVLGCGGGPKGNRVSGTVTFEGRPVPLGKIYFNPDKSKNNTGQTGFADIKDGKFDTGEKGMQGTVSGPVVVRIEGFEEIPPMGEVTTRQLFFPWETSIEVPKGVSTQKFDVPASAAKEPQAPAGAPVIVP